MDRDKLLKEIQAIEHNLTYYKRDLRRSYKKLKTEFGIAPEKVEDRIEEINTRKVELDAQEEELEEKIEHKLRRIKDGRRRGRI